MFEWGLLALLILALVLLFLHKAQQVQGQAELATIKTTLGALRTAAIMDDLQAKARGRAGATQVNPFELLQVRPVNYQGALSPLQATGVREGSWWFDLDRGCVTYAPLEPRWLTGHSGGAVLRFRVIAGGGPLQLEALEPYLWQGMRVD